MSTQIETSMELKKEPYRNLRVTRYRALWLHLYRFIQLYFNFSGTLIWKAIPLLDESERFSVSLPNAFNFSFSFAWFLRIYLIFLVVGMFKCIDASMQLQSTGVRIRVIHPRSHQRREHTNPHLEWIHQLHAPFNKLTSVFYASVLLLIMNFVITLSK